MKEQTNKRHFLNAFIAIPLLSLVWWLVLPYQFHGLVSCLERCGTSYSYVEHHWELFGGLRILGQTLFPDLFGGLNANGYFTYSGVGTMLVLSFSLAVMSYFLLDWLSLKKWRHIKTRE